MRWLLCLLLLAPAVAAVLDDPTGDVVINHCDAANTPLAAFETMDLTKLEIIEDPTYITMRVHAAAIAQEAGPDSGNYFVHFMRGDQHWVLRMFQDNQGSGAIAHLIPTEGLSVFGPVLVEYPAYVDAAGTIEAAVERNQLRDHEHAPLTRGQSLDQIVVSAQAHATGAYVCDLEGNGGPAIIQDQMPDGWVADAASMTAIYGGADVEGPMDLFIPHPFRASNGAATSYGYEVQVSNLDDAPQNFTLSTQVPAGWTVHVPNGTLLVPAASNASFMMYVDVPFQHVHGLTATAQLEVTSQTATGSADFGVHYLAIPQPAGHHPTVFIHSVTPLGLGTAFSERAGGGDNHMFWNTLEEDPADHDVPISSQTDGGDLVWFGCLSPGLALGLHPDSNLTGAFALEFASELATSGMLTGTISILPDGPRPATCHQARDWDASPLLQMDEIAVDMDGPKTVEGTISVIEAGPIGFQPGSDLLLELRLVPDQSPVVGGTVDLLGGALTLPLQDFHEPGVTFDPAAPQEHFVNADEPEPKESPAGLWALVALVWVARRLK